MSRVRWAIVVLLVVAGSARSDDWPIPRGPSREPLPYRYDPSVLKTIPKVILDDASACVLYSSSTHLLEADGTDEAITHEITRLQSRKGIEKLGEYRSISYDPEYEKLTLNEARVIKANGKIVPIEPKHLQLRDVATDFQIYDQSKQLVISFPNLEVGDIYEVKWTVRGKTPEFGGHFFTRYSFGDDQLPVLRDELRVRVPKGKSLKHAAINGNVDLVVTDQGADRLYHWTARNCRELPREEERPSKEELRLQVAVSTFPTWDTVGKWKQNLRKDCWECTPEVRKVVNEVTRGKATPLEKAKALTYWVRRNVRYHSRGPEGLGYTPHQPQQVLANLYGDCKDQAQLLAVMLREIGLPVWLVTLGTLDDGQVLKEVPSPWGSHAILRTQIDGKDYWIDTTVSLAAWDFLPRSDRDRLTYMTQGAEATLTTTPAFTSRDYRIEQTTYVNVHTDGTSRMKRESIYHGASAWSKRDRWLEVPPGDRRRNVTAELQDAHTKARLISLNIDEKQLRDFDRPVRAEVEFEVLKHFTGDTTREAAFSDSPVWTWLLGYNLDVERRLPYVLPTPFESTHRYVITLPPAYRLESVPESKEVKGKWGEYSLRVIHDPQAPRRVELLMAMKLEKTRVELKEFAEFQQFQDDVSKAYRVWLNLRPTIDVADAASLEKYLAERKYDDADTIKVLARLYLDHDRRDDARKLLSQAVTRFPKDSALWEQHVSASANDAEEEKLYRAMVRQFPDEPRYVIALGAACVRREDHAEAKKVLEPLSKHALGPVRAAACYQLARSAYRQEDASKALTYLQRALLADSATLATIDALHFKARVHEKLGQHKEAIASLQTALDGDPNAREVLEHIIRLELKAGLREAALDHLRRFIIAAGKDSSSIVKAAELNFELGRLDDAFELANRTKSPKAERILGLVYSARNDHAQAVNHFGRAELDSKATIALLQSHLRLGDLSAAARRAETIARMEKPDKKLLALGKEIARLADKRDKQLAQWKVDKDQQVQALGVVNRCLCAERGIEERWPRAEIERLVNDAASENLSFAPLFALRGWLALESGQIRMAIVNADAAVKLQSNEPRAFLVRGRARLEQANVDGALSDLRKATQLSNREDPIVLHWLAAALLEAGMIQQALDTQRLATLLRPKDAELLEQLRRLEAKAKSLTSGISP